MAILETLRNSKLLKHQKPVLILMYPSRLANENAFGFEKEIIKYWKNYKKTN